MKRPQSGRSGNMAMRKRARRYGLPLGLGLVFVAWSAGCVASIYRGEADRVAYKIIKEKQTEALGYSEPFTIETPAETLRRRLMLDQQLPHATSASLGPKDIKPIEQWPDKDYLTTRPAEDQFVNAFSIQPSVKLTLTDALQIAAHESRDYQAQKEAVFNAALQLDLERDVFRRTWTGLLSNRFRSDLEQTVTLDDEGHTDKQPINGFEYGPSGQLSQQFKNGLSFTGALGLDLVSLLTQNEVYSRGIVADVTATLPLLRGAGEFVVTEPLTQAERNVVYAIYTFEHFKHTFAVRVASDYLEVLQQQDQIRNAENNYRSLITSTRRARRLSDAGQLSQIQVDQSKSSELQARQRWVAAQESYQRRLDAFKVSLGLPPDAAVELDRQELDKLTQQMNQEVTAEETASPTVSVPAADSPVELLPPGQGPAGRYEMDADAAVRLGLARRLDLRAAIGQIDDAQRTVAVAADQLQADITLLGTGSAGAHRTLANVSQDDAILRPDEGSYSALLTIDLPFERTRERNIYRTSLIAMEQAVRDAQDLEDQVKLAVRNRLSELLEARESIVIQAAAVVVAQRRVDSTNLSLEAGRAQIRDVLEAQDALLSAQNALTGALVNYRIGELSLQRDLGVLQVSEKGLWQEYVPEEKSD